MAVLRGNQPLYQRALTKASATIQDWYDDSNPRVRAIATTLDELAERDVDPTLPDISQSLGLLKERLAGRLAANNGDQGEAPAGNEGNQGNGGDDS